MSIDQKCTDEFVSPSKEGNAVKSWFLTYPQCPLAKELVLKLLEPLGIAEYTISEEKHDNGDPHLHACIILKKKARFKKDRFDIKDLDTVYHGNYQPVKNLQKCREYVIKDGNYISNVDVEAVKMHKPKLVKEDYLKDPLDLLDEGKLSFFQINNFLKNQDCYKMLLARKTAIPPEEMPKKKRHHWIYGNSNTGKTTMLRQKMVEEKENGWFQIPTNNDWKGYNGEKNLYLDEYKGQLSLQELNRICDGGGR